MTPQEQYSWQCKKAAEERIKKRAELLPAFFWSKVQVTKVVECWPWKGTIKPDGYGQLGFDNRYELAHRLAWIMTYGDPPDHLCVLHKCDNRRCCNPLHLFLGTLKDNNQDRAKKGRSKPCKGESNGRSKFGWRDIVRIREDHTNGICTIKQLAEQCSVSTTAIRAIINRKNWKHV